MPSELGLHEDYFLLAHDNFTGRAHINAEVLGIGLAGALLAHLLVTGGVSELDGALHARGDAEPGDAIAEAATTAIRRHDRPLRWWIEHLRHTVAPLTAQHLTNRGLVSVVTTWLRPTPRYPANDAVAAAGPRLRLRLHATEAPGGASASTTVLAELARSTGLAAVVADAANRHVRDGLTVLAASVPAELRSLTAAVDATLARLKMTTTRGR